MTTHGYGWKTEVIGRRNEKIIRAALVEHWNERSHNQGSFNNGMRSL